MPLSILERLLLEVFEHQRVIGVDICGECSMEEPLPELMEDQRINRETNESLYRFLTRLFHTFYGERTLIIREDFQYTETLWRQFHSTPMYGQMQNQTAAEGEQIWTFRQFFRSRCLVTDGAMGTYYREKYAEGAGAPELDNLTDPEKIASIHREYIEAEEPISYGPTAFHPISIRSVRDTSGQTREEQLRTVYENTAAACRIAQSAAADKAEEGEGSAVCPDASEKTGDKTGDRNSAGG